MLEIRTLESGYGETRVLHGIDLTANKGGVHALLGRNGAGKSTTLKSIIGQVAITNGTIALNGELISNLPPQIIARRGIAYVPETRDIFGSLSVRENLELSARIAGPDAAWSIDRVISFFPNLSSRLSSGGQTLSGGEQQMLAIGRALMADPDILLLDEPTEGLAPIIIQQIFEKLMELKSVGMTILLVEQNLNFALELADDVSLLSRGQVVWRGDAEALRADEEAHIRWLGV
ncbi:MAG: ABC transporter ATP-binding protein [Rhodospirillales bacterium]